MDNTSIKPKFARVLIEREVKKVGSGLILPTGVAERHAPCRGKIIALGETAGWTEAYDDAGQSIMKQTMQIGDEVIFGRHSGAWLDADYDPSGKIKDEGKLFICQDADILCVIKEQ